MPITDQIEILKAALGESSAPSSDFDLNPDVQMPAGRKLRPAGVLVAFQKGPNGLELVLTKRSSRLKHHPGQIAFPGGKVDEGDADVIAAALREADEEIGLNPSNVEVIGTLPCHETVTAFQVTPVLALVRDYFTPIPEPGEVDEVFSVPFEHVVDPARYSIQSRRWQGRRRHYFTAPFGPYYIWGATARMLRGLADRVTR
ncbi:CoA pyrophosphatase [Pelagimonas varians]|uniref:Putative NUDIX hydrolase n=1 Tax=Pelagimonas varians TaxID=696760 RepID=A0A238L3J1_9RHOB|nr:CoA pyrophosphatase [Pelagimonas varians]PYG26576.1 8-oxo-dGTP pyrophosphatase MutT (NUDIX family) [Pelagimonas varians]SMX49430.1 putative NUDIX hydrolase [Pelagimonas varians]